jgi:electron transfer flavoprotein-quinone oxidoreductase
MGECTKGMMGGGFLYTNKDSISLGMVVGMDDLRRRRDGTESWQLLDEFKELPQIRPLIAGGTVAEYSAHTVPEGGISQVPRLAGDGYLVAGDTAGLSLNALVTVRGMDFAIASGYFAAQAVKRAKAAGDFTAAGLASYEASLRDSFVLKDLETARSIPSFMENPRLFTHYPRAVSQLLESIYTIDERPQAGLFKKAWRGAKRDFMNVATARDAWSLRKI